MSRFISQVLIYTLFLPSILLLQGCRTNAMELDEETGIVTQKESYPFISLTLRDEDIWYGSYHIHKINGEKGTRRLDLNNIPDSYTISYHHEDNIIPNKSFRLEPNKFYSLTNMSSQNGATRCWIYFHTDSLCSIHIFDPVNARNTLGLDSMTATLHAIEPIPFFEIRITDLETEEVYIIEEKNFKRVYRIRLNSIPDNYNIILPYGDRTEFWDTITPNSSFHLLPSREYKIEDISNIIDNKNGIKFTTDSAGNIHDIKEISDKQDLPDLF